MESAKKTEILMNTVELLAMLNNEAMGADDGRTYIVGIDLACDKPIVTVSKELPCMKPVYFHKNFITLEAEINGLRFRKDYVRSIMGTPKEFADVYERFKDYADVKANTLKQLESVPF